mgnify:FL=1
MTKGRAVSVVHVEYEVFKWILDNIHLDELKERMATDDVSEKRWEKGTTQAAQYIKNLCDRRTHRLPEDHVDYEEKA